ncbi:MAG: 4-(cytidine 5'-diphospho)-2-C-methyl-D-erythritol kinase [Gemmatimonadaceae bacterium]|nr:4-(cytidine 5'-diphospho)-2-C-methyl-D-erythritol kinase [Gemmatimonadaceae bacterium]
MNRTASVAAQAKVNLALRVLAREANGFHQIETLFCRIDIADAVTVRLDTSGRSLRCHGPAIPDEGLGPTEQNLAWRAAMAFTEAASWATGFAIEVEKHIPVGGGLGGGSADAGAVLRCLNALAPRPLANERLLQIAGTLGADVPFLTQERSALALGWGRGDRLLALTAPPRRACLVVAAPFSVRTADAYTWLTERQPFPAGSTILAADALGRWPALDALSGNDFEPIVFARLPELRAAFTALDAHRGPGGVAVVRMSGSGSTLFALYDGREPAIPLPQGFSGRPTWTSTEVSSVVVT